MILKATKTIHKSREFSTVFFNKKPVLLLSSNRTNKYLISLLYWAVIEPTVMFSIGKTTSQILVKAEKLLCSKNHTVLEQWGQHHVLFLVGCFTCAPDSFKIVHWDTWQRWYVGARLVNGEKLHPVMVGLAPRSLQIEWSLLQEC